MRSSFPFSRFEQVGDEAVAIKDIVGAIAALINVPTATIAPAEAVSRYGPLIGMLMQHDRKASSAKTRAALGWAPTGASLLEDIKSGCYLKAMA